MLADHLQKMEKKANTGLQVIVAACSQGCDAIAVRTSLDAVCKARKFVKIASDKCATLEMRGNIIIDKKF